MIPRVDFSQVELWYTDMQVDKLVDFLKVMESQLTKAKTEWKSDMERQAATIKAKHSRNEFLEFQSDQYWAYEEDYPRMLRSSFLVAVCAFVEESVTGRCRMVKKGKQLNLALNDLHGDVLTKARKYLKDYADVWSSKSERVWQHIREYGKLRNCVVHNGGMLKNRGVNDIASKRELVQDTPRGECLFLTQEC